MAALLCSEKVSISCQLYCSEIKLSCKLSITISLLFFLSSIQRLPLSQATVLSFTAPIMASIAARIILREKLKIAEIGGVVAFSFFLNVAIKVGLPVIR